MDATVRRFGLKSQRTFSFVGPPNQWQVAGVSLGIRDGPRPLWGPTGEAWLAEKLQFFGDPQEPLGYAWVIGW